ncbi:hypothetical protein [Sporisorium scitamineum]|uniref:Uncharacterized protein n=1 Tax=Sporisorium scitamineum TaxID=49012 RepID=A0A0F7RRK5_9BASI|nr:hypothetical protein [Sporisorium scitamineum]
MSAVLRAHPYPLVWPERAKPFSIAQMQRKSERVIKGNTLYQSRWMITEDGWKVLCSSNNKNGDAD